MKEIYSKEEPEQQLNNSSLILNNSELYTELKEHIHSLQETQQLNEELTLRNQHLQDQLTHKQS